MLNRLKAYFKNVSLIYLFILITILALSKTVNSQSTAYAYWVGSSLTPDVGGDIVSSNFSAGSGVTNFQASTLYNNMSANGWSVDFASAESTNDYLEFSVSPKPGNVYVLDQINFFHEWSSATNVGYFRIYYSLDGFLTKTQLGCTNPTPTYSTDGIQTNNTRAEFTASRMIVVPNGKTLTFRIYLWSSNGGSYFRFDNIAINGSTAPVIYSEGLNNSAGSLTLTGGQFYSGNTTSGDNPPNAPQFLEGTHSYGVSNSTATIISNNINTLGGTELSLFFRLAALSIGTATNGLDADDFITVDISPDGGLNWYYTLGVAGNNQAFWSFGSGIGGAITVYDADNVPVTFSPDGGGTRTPLGTTFRTDGYSTIKITGLPASSNLKYKITLKNNSINERWLIDEIAITGIIATVVCPTPIDLKSPKITTNSAFLSWSPVQGASSYSLQFKPISSATYTTINNISSNTYSLTSLTSNTKYEYRVQAKCGNDLSNYSQLAVFSTSVLRTCGITDSIRTTNLTQNNAVIEWNPVAGAFAYNLQWKVSTASSFNTVSNVSNTKYTLNGLLPNTNYTIQIQAVCNSRNGVYSNPYNFSTIQIPTCATPNNLNASNITTTSAILSWSNVSGAFSYNLQWKPTSATAFNTVNGLVSANYNLTGLSANTNYTFQVQAVCQTQSNYSTIRNFTSGTAPSTAVNEVIYIWSGAIQPTSATVVAKLTSATTSARAVVSTSQALTNPIYSSLATANTSNNFMAKMNITGLQPNTTYYYAIESNGVVDNSNDDIGKFKTPGDGPYSFKFTHGSCSSTGAHPVYTAMQNKNPLFFLNTGDLHYRNPNSSNISVHRDPYELRILSQPASANFLKNTAFAFTWDDHDYCGNNVSGDQLTGTANARQAYQEYVPHYPLVAGSGNVPIQQAYTIGRVHFIMPDLRSVRLGNSMMGAAQKAWFKQQCLYARDNCLMIAFITNTMFGGDLTDNWGGFPAEKAELSNFFRDNGIKNLMILQGDAHMTAIDNGTNHDFSTGSNNPYDYPVFTAAALNNSGNDKGATFSEGKFANPTSAYGQYGMVEVTDNGGPSISITFKGYRTAGNSSTDNVVTSYTFTRTICPNINMPVPHLSIREIADNNSIKINWDVENGGSTFTLLKSANNIDFDVVKKIESSKGDFVDENPFSGWNYYRLISGTGEVLMDKSIATLAKGNKIVTEHDRVENKVLTNFIGFENSVDGYYTVFNSDRKPVSTGEFKVSADNKFELNANELSTGDYKLYLFFDGINYYSSFSISK